MALTGFIWRPFNDARDALANSTAFRTWCDADNADEAKLLNIVLFEERAEPSAQPDALYRRTKFAVIMPPDGALFNLTKVTPATGLSGYDWSRSLVINFVEEVQEFSEDAMTAFFVSLGSVIESLLDDSTLKMAMRVTTEALAKSTLKWEGEGHRGYQVSTVWEFST